MRFQKNGIRHCCNVALLAGAAILSGCAYSTADKINADFQGYLSSEYSVAYVPPALRAKLTAVGVKPRPGFQDVSMTITLRQSSLGQQTPTVNPYQVTFTSLGDGFYREVRELRNNDFLTARFIYLTWAGLFTLKSDTLVKGDGFPVANGEVKDVVPFKFDPARMKAGDALSTEWKFGARPQAFNLLTEKENCVVQKTGAASGLHKNISGTAIWMDCTSKNDKGGESKKSIVYLIDYALTLTLDFRSPTRTQAYELNEFSVR